MARKRMILGIIMGVIVVVILGAIIHAIFSSRTQRTSQGSHPGATSYPATKPAHSAATRPAEKDRITLFSLPALLVADNTADLYAKASGYVDQLKVDIGSRVRAGDVLLKLVIPEMDDELRQSEAQLVARHAQVEALKAKAVQAQLAVRSAQAEQRRVESELALSRITHERKVQLYQGRAIPAQELDEAKSRLGVSEAQLGTAKAAVAGAEGAQRAAEAEVRAAEAQVALAAADVARLKSLIAYQTIAAPFDGVITRRNVDVGWFVRSAAQGTGPWLLTLDKVDRLRVVFDVPEAEVPLVRVGTPVDIEILSLREPPFRSAVTRTAVAVRSDTRTMRAEVDVENTNGRLSPGMYARAVVHGARPAAYRTQGVRP